MKPEKLSEIFQGLCKPLTRRPDVLFAEFLQENKATVFSMTLRLCRIEIVYSWRWTVIAPPSVLYCRVYLGKNDELFFHLPEILPYLNSCDYRACYFPYVENEERMIRCFRALLDMVEEYIPRIEKLGQTGMDQQIIQAWIQREYPNDEAPEGMAEYKRWSESLLVGRYTTQDAYEAFLRRDWKKARKLYRKLEKSGLQEYEQGLCRFLENEDNRDFVPIHPDCFSLKDYRAVSSPWVDLLGMVICAVPIGLLCSLVIALTNGIMAQGTVVFFGMPWWSGFVFGGLPGVFAYGLLQRRVFGLLGGKFRGRGQDYVDIMDTYPKLNKPFAVVVGLLAAISVFGSGFLAHGTCMRLYDDRCVYAADDLWAFESFPWDDVEAVYHISARYNEYGDRIERSSYVLLLKDGRQLDLDGTCTEAETRQLVFPLLPEHLVVFVDSERDIP